VVITGLGVVGCGHLLSVDPGVQIGGHLVFKEREISFEKWVS